MILKKAKLAYNDQLVSKALNKPKQIWKIIKNSTGSSSAQDPYKAESYLNAPGFNNFFISSVHDVIKEIPKSRQPPSHYLATVYSNVMPNSFVFQHVSVEDIYKAISALSNSNCLDLYNMNSSIVKNSSFYIAEVLCHVFNCCIDDGCFPDELKKTKVIPVHKKGDRNDYSQYRPISIVPTLSKVFEKLISKQIVDFLDQNQLLYKDQFGFRTNHSTIDAVLRFVQACLEGKEEKLFVGSKFYDLSKAFDTINHKTLLLKLKYLGFSPLSTQS
jgi:hypothetical protein